MAAPHLMHVLDCAPKANVYFLRCHFRENKLLSHCPHAASVTAAATCCRRRGSAWQPPSGGCSSGKQGIGSMAKPTAREAGVGCGERRSEVPRKMEIDVVKGRHALHNIFDIFAQVSGNRVLGYNSRSALPISQL